MVLYVSDIAAETGEWKDVFIHDTRTPQKPKVILARTGRLHHRRAQKNGRARPRRTGVTYTFQVDRAGRLRPLRLPGARYCPLPYEEFFPELPLAKGDREMTLGGAASSSVADLRGAGQGPMTGTRYDVECHKKFAIPTACVRLRPARPRPVAGQQEGGALGRLRPLASAVIFIYYVLIRLGEQAGDTGMLPPWLAMWAANIVLGAGRGRPCWRSTTARPPSTRSTRAHYTALLPGIRRRREGEAGRPRARSGRGRPARGGRRGAHPAAGAVPIPGLLDRYIVRTYVGNFALVAIAFWAHLRAGQLHGPVRRRPAEPGRRASVVFHYYAFTSPPIIHLITPVAVLVAVLITFGVMARHNEITAMKAAGISIYRIGAARPGPGRRWSCFGMFERSEYLLPAHEQAWPTAT